MPWVAAPPGAPPREARPRRPPSVAACLSFEYDVEAGSVAALVAGGGGGAEMIQAAADVVNTVLANAPEYYGGYTAGGALLAALNQ